MRWNCLRSALTATFTLCLPFVSGVAADIQQEFVAQNSKETPADFVKPDNAVVDVTELAIERTICFGTCPIYSFSVKSSGAYTLNVIKFAKPLGTKSGSIRKSDFERAAWLISQTRFFTYANEYTEPVTDLPTTYLKVVQGGKTKIISIYGRNFPLELVGVQREIEHLAILAGLDLSRP